MSLLTSLCKKKKKERKLSLYFLVVEKEELKKGKYQILPRMTKETLTIEERSRNVAELLKVLMDINEINGGNNATAERMKVHARNFESALFAKSSSRKEYLDSMKEKVNAMKNTRDNRKRSLSHNKHQQLQQQQQQVQQVQQQQAQQLMPQQQQQVAQQQMMQPYSLRICRVTLA